MSQNSILNDSGTESGVAASNIGVSSVEISPKSDQGADDCKLNNTNRAIVISEEVAIYEDKSATTTGFVTFTSRVAQLEAVSCKYFSYEFPNITCETAPTPSDIIWKNIASSPVVTRQTAKFTSLLLSIGLVFMGAIISGITFISDLSNTEKFIPLISSLPAPLYALIQGQLSVILLNGVVGLLPVIIRGVSVNIEKWKSKNIVTARVIKW